MEIEINKRFQTLLVVWFALLMSIGLYFLLSRFAAPEVDYEPVSAANRFLIVALAALATFLVIGSFFVKRRFMARSIDKQEVLLVHQGHTFAWAMCEVSALLGVIERFAIGYREYYLLMLLAAVGIAVQFPNREHLLAAGPKTPIGGASS
jgi:hypothetical protein